MSRIKNKSTIIHVIDTTIYQVGMSISDCNGYVGTIVAISDSHCLVIHKFTCWERIKQRVIAFINKLFKH